MKNKNKNKNKKEVAALRTITAQLQSLREKTNKNNEQ